MRRTTIYLDIDLEARLKQEIARLGIPMAEYIREAIGERLNRSQHVRSPYAGAFESGHTDTAERAEELLAEDFGEG